MTELEAEADTSPVRWGCLVAWAVLAATPVLAALPLALGLVPPVSTLGTELVYRLEVEKDRAAPPVATVADALKKRLRSADLDGATVAATTSREVVIRLPTRDSVSLDTARAVIARRGELTLQLVAIAGPAIDASEIPREAERILNAKAAGTFDPTRDRWDAAPGPRGPVLLEARGGISASSIAEASVTTDSLGRPAVAFTLDAAGEKLFWNLTSTNIGRAIAIVLDGEVLSEPVIRAAIGKHGIIEGGQSGFSDVEVRAIAAALGTGPLGVRPVLRETRDVEFLGRARIRVVIHLALAFAVALLLVALPRCPGAWTRALVRVVLALLVLALIGRSLRFD